MYVLRDVVVFVFNLGSYRGGGLDQIVGMGTGRVVSWTAVDAGGFKGAWGGNEMPVWGGGSGLEV
ncbi:hypothetical protein BDV41DRAFT_537051 [Aspergillus transmontanensis]|uniref:Uncharacterized protein n=1 Tax=Aspergillus transmontanensis TaxID=1034304 RepID=A0A5N6VXU3_9EURO|nr:hypothetical protein BDV41DRAFT_537051 [Aspergillus transmontanensis]